MFAVEMLGSYITRGVSRVSGPFHPFGGAVDIIVVEQQDGSFKSSPWYVRFGKFQGVLKAKEKVVSINVNGDDADFHMYLDHKGEAYFLREVDGEEEGFEIHAMSSGDERDVKLEVRTPRKSKSCNYDAKRMDLIAEIDADDEKILGGASSQQGKVFGLVFGRRSVKEKNGFREEEGCIGVGRESSLERAEIAADLLEVGWTTGLPTSRKRKNKTAIQNKGDRSVSFEVNGSSDSSGSQNPEYTILQPDGQDQSQTSSVNYIEEFTLGEMYMDVDLISKGSQSSHKADISNSCNDGKESEDTSEVSSSSLHVMQTMEFEDERFSFECEHSNSRAVANNNCISESDSLSDRAQSFTYCATETFTGQSDDCSGQVNESLYMAYRALHESGEVLPGLKSESTSSMSTNEMNKDVENFEITEPCVSSVGQGNDHLTQFNATEAMVASEVGVVPNCDLSDRLVEDIHSVARALEEVSNNHRINFPSSSVVIESQNLAFGSNEEVGSADIFIGASVSNSAPRVSDHDNFSDDSSKCPPSSSACEHDGDSLSSKATDTPPSENSEEVQFSFSDLPDSKFQNVEQLESNTSDAIEKGCCPPSAIGNSDGEANESIIRDSESHPSIDNIVQDDQLNDHPDPMGKSNKITSPISINEVHRDIDERPSTQAAESLPSMRSRVDEFDVAGARLPLSSSMDSNINHLKIRKEDSQISSELVANKQTSSQLPLAAEGPDKSEDLRKIFSDPAVEVSLCKHLLYEGMGYEAAAQVFDAEKLNVDEFASFGPAIIKNDKLVVRIGGLYFPWDAALPIVSSIGSPKVKCILEPKGMIPIGHADKASEVHSQKSTNSRNGPWRIWPFSFKNSQSSRGSILDSETPSESPRGKVRDSPVHKPKPSKKKIRANTPTSEQLASLKLKEGKNVVMFTFSTAMLGKQQVDARIYLWKWNTKIVISDVDGTITKSDVLGQFMPLVGVDWSQTGVTHFFSAIKDNGYHLLFLSARSISQAYNTRQFLFNLKQDGKSLPEGPVFISPDGLFPSLYREVIRRAPHEFKIACLEGIKALFPPDHNPFYAGFGNRDTDEISYLRVGIPMGKIFIINPKGQVAVNRRMDTKSYTSLHALVNGMFPDTSSIEKEDFNSWNFWRLPPPDILI